MDEVVQIPKRLILELLRTENTLSSLIDIPPDVRPVVEQCTSKIREIAVKAGLRVGESSGYQSTAAVVADQSEFIGCCLVKSEEYQFGVLSRCIFRDL